MDIKVWWGRTVSYVSMINSSMIFFMFLVTLKDRGIINFDVGTVFVPALILGIFLLIVIGYIETEHFKANQKEKSKNFWLTPEFVEMYNDIKYIKKKNET